MDFLPEAEEILANTKAELDAYTAELQAMADQYALEQSVTFAIIDFLPEAQAIFDNVKAELDRYTAELTRKAEEFALIQSVTSSIMDFLPEADALMANIKAEADRYTAELQAKADEYALTQIIPFIITDFLPEAEEILANVKAEIDRYTAELTEKANQFALTQSVASSIMDFLPEAETLAANIKAETDRYRAELQAKADQYAIEQTIAFAIMDFLPEAETLMANIKAELDAYTKELTEMAEKYALEQSVTFSIIDFLPEAERIVANTQAELDAYTAELTAKAAAYDLAQETAYSIMSFLPEAQDIADNVNAEIARYTAELQKIADEMALKDSVTFRIEDFLLEANTLSSNVQTANSTKSMAYHIRELSEFGRTINDVIDAWDNLSDSIANDAGDWDDVLQNVYNTVEKQIAESFETLGRSIVEGGDAWDGWGTSALRALSSVLRSVGYQLLAQVALNTVLGITALLTGNIAGFFTAAGSAAIGLAAAAAAFVGAGIIDGLADQYERANAAIDIHNSALDEQNNALKENRELFTKASMAAAAYAAVLAKVTGSAADFYAELQGSGADITDKIIDSLSQGFGSEDFLYAMQEYITESVIKAAVYTDTFIAEAAAIGKEIASGIAGGFSTDQLQGLKDRLAGLYEQAATAAEAATGIVMDVFSSYDVGALNVRGDQLARIHNKEMILEPGIAEQARMSGVYIGPVSTLGDVGRGSLAPAAAQIRISATGTLQVDGREIGRIAFQFADEFQGNTYGH
jgi:hypothetical protein